MRFESKFGIGITVTVVVMALLVVGIENHQPEFHICDDADLIICNHFEFEREWCKQNDCSGIGGLNEKSLTDEEWIKEICESSGNVYSFENNNHTCTQGDKK